VSVGVCVSVCIGVSVCLCACVYVVCGEHQESYLARNFAARAPL